MNRKLDLAMRREAFADRQTECLRDLDHAILMLQRTKDIVSDGGKFAVPHLFGNIINGLACLQKYAEERAILEREEAWAALDPVAGAGESDGNETNESESK